MDNVDVRIDVEHSAFTLIELLVSIAIIAILIGILIPGLAHARKSASIVQSSNNLRQLGSVFSEYHAISDDLYPAIDEDKAYQASRYMWVQYPYWQVFETWVAILYPLAPIDAEDNFEMYISPLDRRRVEQKVGTTSSYSYSTSFVGHPRLWSGSASAEEKYKTAQRVSAVMLPSSKVLLWDEGYLRNVFVEKPYVGINTPMLFADQSVRRKDPSLSTEIVINPFETSTVRNERLHNTKDGVQGIDYQP